MQEKNTMRKTVTLTLTESCNLKCTYCYEENKTPKSMNYDTAKAIIEKELLADDGMNDIEFDFFGGEPFIQFDLLKKCCNFIWSKDWGKKIICFASTNGTLVHGEIKKWLDDNKDRFWCGLSLDGTKYMHDLNRCESFDDIDLDFFKSTWPEQPVKMTISRDTLPYLAEGIEYIHSLGFKLNANLAYGIDWDDPDVLGIYENQLSRLVDFYIKNPKIEIPNILSMAIDVLPLKKVHEKHKWCGTGEYMHTYSCDGVCYPCQFFMPLSVGEEKAKASLNIDFSDINVITDKYCENCPILPICPTCYGSNYMETGNVAIRNKHLCKTTKLAAMAVSFLEYKKLEPFLDNIENLDDNQLCMLKGIEIIQTKLSLD